MSDKETANQGTSNNDDGVIRKHHFLVCGTVLYHSVGSNPSQNQVGAIPENAVFLTDDAAIRVRGIAQAQRAVFAQFTKRAEQSGERLEVDNIVITMLHYLGYFSETEFNEPPAGQKLQQRAANDIEAVLVEAEAKANAAKAAEAKPAERPNLKVIRTEGDAPLVINGVLEEDPASPDEAPSQDDKGNVPLAD